MPGPEPHRGDASPELGTSSDGPATTPHGLICLRSESDNVTIRFALSGELDIAAAPELDHALRTSQQSAQRVTVDLRRVSFMDCRGLAVILAGAKRAGAAGSSFRVVRGPPQVHRLFTLTNLDRQIEIGDNG